jgi:hypothetical protein
MPVADLTRRAILFQSKVRLSLTPCLLSTRRMSIMTEVGFEGRGFKKGQIQALNVGRFRSLGSFGTYESSQQRSSSNKRCILSFSLKRAVHQ